MYAEENTSFFTGLFISIPLIPLISLKRPPTNSSPPGLLPVQRRVLRVLRESRVRFRDGDHGSSLTASSVSALSLLICSIICKKHITCFKSDQSSACNLIPSGVRKCFSSALIKCLHLTHRCTHTVMSLMRIISVKTICSANVELTSTQITFMVNLIHSCV